MIPNFDAIAFEREREAKYRQSRSIQLEISSCHNYGEGITYYYLHAGDMEIGQYYRDPWDSLEAVAVAKQRRCAPAHGWYWQSSINGEKAHCQTREIALTQIQSNAYGIPPAKLSVRSSARLRWSR